MTVDSPLGHFSHLTRRSGQDMWLFPMVTRTKKMKRGGRDDSKIVLVVKYKKVHVIRNLRIQRIRRISDITPILKFKV